MPQGLEIDFLLPRDETDSDVNMLGDDPVAHLHRFGCSGRVCGMNPRRPSWWMGCQQQLQSNAH